MVQPGEEVVGLDHVDLGGAGSVEPFLKVPGLVRNCGGACVERIGCAFGSHDRQVGQRDDYTPKPVFTTLQHIIASQTART